MGQFSMSGHCSCGAVSFRAERSPLFRFCCHCSSCQSFNESAFADAVVFWLRDLNVVGESTYEVYQRPAFLRRGRCAVCTEPSIEPLSLPGFPPVTIIPVKNISDQQGLPTSSFHMFYNQRLADVLDNAPKCNRFVGSQVQFVKMLLNARFASQ